MRKQLRSNGSGRRNSCGRGSVLRRAGQAVCETMEQRILLASISWNTDASGYWDVAANWSGGVVPGAGDDVVISRAANPTVTIRTGVSVDSLDSQNGLALTSGSLAVATSSDIAGSFTFSGGSLNANGPLTISGSSNWSGGNIGAGVVTNDGTLTLTSGNDKTIYNGASISNNGTVIHAGGRLVLSNGTVQNQTTGVYDFQIDNVITGNGGTNNFNNVGLLKKSAGSGDSTIQIPFNNSGAGAIEVDTGSITLAGSGTLSGGAFTVANGAILDLTGGNTTHINGAFTGSGLGTTQLASGALRLDGGSATFNFPAGFFNWFAGSIMAGTLTNTGTMALTGTSDKRLSETATISNTGRMIQANGRLVLSNGTVQNQTTGVYDFQTDNNIGTDGGTNAFDNAGTLRKSVGTGMSSLNAPFYNDAAGIINVQTGTLTLGAGGSSAGGTFNVATNAVLDLTGGSTHFYTGTYTGSGGGSVQLANGQINITSATFNFPAGFFNWLGGNLSHNTLNNTGFITLAGVNDKRLDNNIILNNTGTIIQTGGRLVLSNGTLQNAANGTYDFQVDGTVATDGGTNAFNNVGILKKSIGTGISAMSAPFNNSAAGIINVQTGTITLNAGGSSAGGTFNVATNAVLDLTGGTTHSYTGTYTGSGGGSVQFSGGQINITAATFNFPAGLFNWLGGNLAYDTLNNTGFITLTGGGDRGLIDNIVLNNTGTIIQAGGRLILSNGTLQNANSGVYDFQTDNAVSTNGGTNAFNNVGTLKKSAGTGTSSLNAPFNNDAAGVINVQTGTITLNAGGSSGGGTFNVASNAVLDLTGGNQPHFTGTYTGSGDGSVQLASGRLNLSSDATFNFPAGFFNWIGGNIGPGTLNNTGFITLAGSGDRTIDSNAVLNNTGTVIQAAGRVVLSNGTIQNATTGLYDFQTDNVITTNGGTNAFNNAGTLGKSAGSAASVVQAPFYNTAAGIIDVHTGTIVLAAGGASLGGHFLFDDGAALDLTGGTTNNFSGAYTASGHGQVQINNGRLNVGNAGATFNFDPGVMQWAGGNISGAGGLLNQGTITLVGTADKTIDSNTTLTNNGRIVQVAGRLVLSNGTVQNTASGVYDFQTDNNITTNGGTNAFNNVGVLRKSAGTGTSALSAPFYNDAAGIINVQTGTLTPNAGGSSAGGTFNVATNAVLDITGGTTNHFTGTYTGSGGGSVQLASGRLNLSGDATFNFPTGFFNWIGGNIGPGTLNNTGFITLAGGGDRTIDSNGVLNNTGTIIQAAGRVVLSNGSIQNAATGLYDFQTDNTITTSGGTNAFNNVGTLSKSAGTGTSAMSAPFYNDAAGIINVQTGVITLNAGGSSAGGTFNVSSGAVLDLTGGYTNNFTGTYTGSGGGSVQLANGRLSVSGAPTFNFPAGFFNWIGGNIGPGTLNNTGFITLAGGGDRTIDSGGVLNNTGTVIQPAGRLVLSNGTVQNAAGGVYDIQTDNVVTPSGGSNNFNNTGTLKKSAGTGTATISVPFSNTGTVQVSAGTLTLNAGVTQLAGGTLSAGTWNVLNGSTLDIPNLGSITTNNASVTLSGVVAVFAPINALATNTGTFNVLGGRTFTTAGAFDNQGTLSIGAAFNVGGTFTQSANSTLNVNIGGTPASALFGRLTSTAATLAGTLHIGIYGGYGPSAGQTFPVMNFPSKTGSFAQTTGLSIGNVQYFQATTTATAVTVRANANTADIQPTLGAIPATGFVGDNLTIQYSVRNTETIPTLGDTWTDSVYLSTGTVLDGSAILLGQVAHNGQLAGRASYNATLTAPLPPIASGDYHVLVQVNSDGGIPDSGPDNNVQASAATIHTDMNALTPGVTTTVSVAAGQSLYYRLDEPAGLDIMLSALLGKLHQAEIYIRSGQLPDTSNYDSKAGDNGTLQLSIPVLHTAAVSYFVLVRGLDGAGGSTPIAIGTRQMGFEIVSSSPVLAPNTGATDVTVTGSHFSSNTAVSLVFPGGSVIQPTSVDFSNSNTLIAHFNLTGAIPGNYDLRLQDSGQTATSPAALHISFAQANHSGTLSGSEHWFNGFVHRVSGTLIVPNGVTLTIDPGAIVKFESFAGIQVDPGGTLIAQGTLARNVIFTSIRDDSQGGDTNGDGNATAPSAGDWGIMYISGSASFDHAQVLYGGGNPYGSWGATASIRTAGGTLSFANSRMSQSFFDGILAWGGTVNVTNSIFTGIDRAISAHPGGIVTVTNSTFDNNRIALLAHGGNITINNCVVNNSSGSGIQFDFGGVPSVHYTDVFSTVPNAVNYAAMPSQTGSNGNISADPKLRDPSRGDYRLGYLSPAIDAADGTLAPATDFAGVSRYDDPRTPNTGIAMTNGSFADMGALEFVESASSSLDLAVASVSGPPQISAGQTAIVQWTDVNNGTDAVHGSWHDAIELVSQTAGGGEVVLEAGEVVSSAILSAGQSATFSTEITVPYGTEGVWRFRVRTNSRGEIFEGQNYGNNTTDSVQTTVLVDPHITVGTTAGGTFAAVDSGLMFKVHPTSGVDTLFTLGRADAGNTDIFISAGSAPTTTTFDAHATGSGLTTTFAIPSARDTDYYILLVPRTLSAGPVAFTLDSAIAQYSLSGLGLSQGGNAGTVTVPILGAGLRPGAIATLLASGITLAATTVYFEDSTHIYATFDLTGLAAGAYDLKVSQSGVDRTLATAFNVVASNPANLQMKILMPPLVRSGKEFTATVQYTNVGNQDMPAPFVLIDSSTGNQLRLSSDTTLGSTAQFLAISPDGPAGILRPGETGSVTLRVVGILGNNSLTPSWSGTDNTDTVDWPAIKTTVEVENVPTNWDTIWTTRIQSAGTHVGDYIRLLDGGATLRGTRNGVRSNSIQDNLNFLVQQALLDDASHISGNVYLNDSIHPLGGVIVQATSATTGLSYSSMTTADGLVRIPDAPAGTYTIRVLGYLNPATLPTVILPANQTVSGRTWTVQSGAHITGQIIAPNATDFSQVAVGLSDANGNQFTATISSTGVYTSSELPAGVYDLRFSSATLSISSFSGVTVADGQTIRLADVVATPGGSVSGTVRRAGTNAPLSGVTVLVRDAGDTPRSAITDSNGVYTIAGITPGPHTIAAGFTGSVVQTVDNVAVASGALTSGVDFLLGPSATLGGTVTVDSVPASGAAIQLLSGGNIIAATATDNTGHYTMPNLPAGTYTLSVDYWKSHTFTADVTFAAGDNATHDVALTHAALVSGLVKDGAHNPLAGVNVAIVYPDGSAQTTMTQSDGSYGFGRLAAGHYIAMLADGSHRHAFNVTGDATSEAFNMTLTVGYITGRVLDSGNNPPAVGQVELLQSGQVVAIRSINSDGTFTIPTVVEGTYQLLPSVGGQSYAAVSVVVKAGKLTTTPDLKPGTASLNVQFNDAGTNSAVLNGFATLQRLDQPDQLFRITLDVTGTGLAGFTHLALGSYLVSFRSPDLASVQRVVTVAAGVNTLALTATAAASVSGTILDHTGAPLPGANVMVFDPAKPQAVWQDVTDINGAYNVGGIPAGTYSFVVVDTRTTPDTAVRENSVVVALGSSTTRNQQLVASSIRVSGTVSASATDIPAGAIVTATSTDGIVVAVATADGSGLYTLLGLIPGTYTISASASGFTVTSRSITVTANQARTGFNLAATWVADPVQAADSESGISSFFGNVGETIHRIFGKLLGGEPVDTAGTLGHPQIPANCPLALAWLRERTYWEWVKNQRFDAWHGFWDGASTVLRNDIGVFTINFVKFVSNFLSAQSAMLGGMLQQLNGLKQLTSNVALKNPSLTYSELQNLDKEFEELTQIQTSLRNIFEGGAQVPGNLISSSQATPISAGQALYAKLADISSWSGPGDVFDCLSLAADVGAQVSQLISSLALAGQIFGKVNPELASLIGKISDGLSTVKAGIDGVVDFSRNLKDLQEYQRQYDEAVARRNAADANLQAAIANCKHPKPINPPPPPPPNRTFHHNPPTNTNGGGSFDPNDKTTVGFGAQGAIAPGTTIAYRIDFENQASALLPAQTVTVTDPLSASLDWSTLQLGSIGFNGVSVTVPEGLTSFDGQTTVASDPNYPVDIHVRFDQTTGILTWVMQSIDPVTGQAPEDPTAGFLPPDNPNHDGQGFVNYTILPKSSLADGDTFTNQAHIVFDQNAPIDTPTVTNTIDAAAPTSSLLAQLSGATAIGLTWSGSDGVNGSGVAYYDIYYTDNGSPLKPLLLDTTTTSLNFTGVTGHAYAFYSTAVDNTGFRQTAAAAPAQVALVAAPVLKADPIIKGKKSLFITATGGNDTILVNRKTAKGDVEVIINGTSKGVFLPTGRIVVNAGGGDDTVTTGRGILLPVEILGGAGNDTLTSGDGPAILVGGDGNDRLTAGAGRAVLIGGRGADTLLGGTGDDLLISGYTKYDASDALLYPILNEWARKDKTYAARVADLTKGGGLNGTSKLIKGTVFDDLAADTLTGRGGTDWFIISKKDTITDKAKNETSTTI